MTADTPDMEAARLDDWRLLERKARLSHEGLSCPNDNVTEARALVALDHLRLVREMARAREQDQRITAALAELDARDGGLEGC